MKKGLLVAVLVAIFLSGLGCRKPYDKPEYKNIANNETAFVIPLEGKISDQAKFQSEEYLRSLQVATKRIRITHRWNQTGRRGYMGEWIDAVKVITVDRAPVTRQWTADDKTGTTEKDEAIWVESKDSVTFSIGFSTTAYIEENKTALFLYNYTSSGLAKIMDTEIRARIQSAAAEKCGEYDLDELRGKKKEVIASVREDVILFFAKRGVSITTIGMFGGFNYKNPNIQLAIDKVFEAQQLEDVEEAKRLAALKQKETIMILADAEAEKIEKIAEAEAEKIRKIASAASEAQQNPLFLALKRLEVEEKRISAWNGIYPNWYMGSDLGMTAPDILMSVNTEK